MGFIKAKYNQFMSWWVDNNHTILNFISIVNMYLSPVIAVIYYTYDQGNVAGAIALGVIVMFIGMVIKELSNYYAPYVGIPVLDHRLTVRHSDHSDIEYANVPLMIQYLTDLEDWFEANGYL